MMRPICCLFSASALLLWETAESTTAGDSQSNEAAFNVSTVPFRMSIGAIVNPKLLRQQDSAVKATDSNHRNNEERGLLDSLKMIVDALESSAPKEFLKNVRSRDFLKKLGIKEDTEEHGIHQELVNWLVTGEDFSIDGVNYGDVDLIKQLQTVKEKEALANPFLKLQEVNYMSQRAYNLQGALAVTFPVHFKPMVSNWLKELVKPSKVYEMLLIDKENIFNGGLTNVAEWFAKRSKITLWLHYVAEFNAQVEKRLSDYERHLVNQRLTPDSRFRFEDFKPLKECKMDQALVDFVNIFGDTPAEQLFVSAVNNILRDHNSRLLEGWHLKPSHWPDIWKTFDAYANLKKSPQFVYEAMFPAVFTSVKEMSFYYCRELQTFLIYIDVYRERVQGFGDDELARFLLEELRPDGFLFPYFGSK